MMHQIARQEIARPLTLGLPDHVLGSDLDVGSIDSGEFRDFRRFV